MATIWISLRYGVRRRRLRHHSRRSSRVLERLVAVPAVSMMSPAFLRDPLEEENGPALQQGRAFFFPLEDTAQEAQGRRAALHRPLYGSKACWPGRNGVAARDAVAQIALASHCSEFVSNAWHWQRRTPLLKFFSCSW